MLNIDTDRNKVEKINSDENYIDDINSEKMRSLVGDGLLKSTTMYKRISELNIIFICVPTPFTPNKEPDISYIKQTAENISAHLRKEQLIILKSTTFPETTEKNSPTYLKINRSQNWKRFLLNILTQTN